MSAYERVNALFAQHPDIDEVGIVPVVPGQEVGDGEEQQSCVVGGCKLALLTADVKELYVIAKAHFLRCRADARHVRKQQRDDTPADGASTLLAASRAMLLVNANHYAAWNARKRLVQSGDLTSARELSFVDLVLTLHPKTAVGWAHRQWLLRQSAEHLDASCLRREASVCERASELHPKNYYAWSHRLHVLSKAGSQGCAAHVTEERERAAAWVKSHISDYSGMHFLQACLRVKAALALHVAVHEDGSPHTWRALARAYKGQAMGTPHSNGLQQCLLLLRDHHATAEKLWQRYPEQDALAQHVDALHRALDVVARLHGSETTGDNGSRQADKDVCQQQGQDPRSHGWQQQLGRSGHEQTGKEGQ